MRRRNLTLGMTNHHRRTHTTRLPQPRQRHHHPKQHRLHHIHPIQPRRTLHPTQHVLERPIHKTPERLTTLTQPLSKHRRTVKQLNRHPRPLTTLTAKHKHNPTSTNTDGRAIHDALDDTHSAHTSGQSAQAGRQLFTIADHDRARLEVRSTAHQRKAHIKDIQPGVGLHVCHQPLSLTPQALDAATREHQRDHTANTDTTLTAIDGRGPARRDVLEYRRLLEDHVRVGAADPERRHARPARPPALRPRHRPRSAAAPRPPTSRLRRTARPRAASAAARRAASPCTILITPATPAAAWVWPMFDFTEPSHSGRSSGAVLPVGGQQRLRLDRVAQRGARAVRLDRVHLGGGQPGARPAPARITRCCDGPFGAVRPLHAPSWLTALPRTTASTRCPLRRASDSRSSSSTPAPSAKPVPSAPPANDLHRPSAASPRCRQKSTNSAGVAITVTPPASASEHSPAAQRLARPGAAPPATTSRPCRP